MGTAVMAEPTSKSIKIDIDLWKKIKIIIAASDGTSTIQEFVNEVLTPVVNREYPKAVKRIGDAQKE